MTINVINPSYNLQNKTIETSQNLGQSSKTGGNTSGSVQSFSKVLENVMSQSNSSEGAVPSAGNSGTVNLDDIFQKASDTYHVPVALLKAVAKAESNFNSNAVSSCGAQGIMQLMPGTAKSLGVTDAFDPEQNIMGGAKYLSQQLDRYDGNTVLALAAYNAGPGNVKKYNGVPPFAETQRYIGKVMGYAGESLVAGSAPLNIQATSTASNLTGQNSGTNLSGSFLKSAGADGLSGDLIQNLGLGLLNDNEGEMDAKDYALFMNLYRYKMQLSILNDSDSDSDSSLFGSFV